MTAKLGQQFTQFSRNARLFLAATVISGVATSSLQLFFNIYLRSRNFDLDFIGLMNAIPSAAALVVGVPMGILSDRMGRRRAMLVGLSVSTLAAWGMVNAPSRELMLVMGCIKGIADSLYMLSQAPFMMRAAGDKERTLLFSLNFGLATIAGAVGNLLAGQLPGWFGSWLGVGPENPRAYQAVLTVSVLTGGISLVPVWLIHELKWPGLRREPALALEDFRRLWRPAVLRLAAPNFIIGFGAAILIPYMNLFFRDRFAVPDAPLGVLFSLSAALTGLATVVGPSIAHRLDSKIKAVVVTQGASLVFLMMLGFVPNFQVAAVSFLMRAALMNMASPLYSAFVMEHCSERERGAVNSVMMLVWEVGWTVGPYLSGVVQAGWGFSPLFAFTGTLYAVGIGLTWLFFSKTEAETRLEAKPALPPG